jgi:hypothetical protein
MVAEIIRIARNRPRALLEDTLGLAALVGIALLGVSLPALF